MPETVFKSGLLTIDPNQELVQIGISSELEAMRFRKVQQVAGYQVARTELYRNTKAYEREFIDDDPVSFAHTYFHHEGQFYSEPIGNEIFRVGAQIHPGERDGKTFDGFQRYQRLVTESLAGTVSLWYSPAGSAGKTPPFDKLYFDSGRLYVGVNQGDGTSRHLDVKVNEDAFPIDKVLQRFSQLSDNGDIFDFLKHPVSTGLSIEDFLAILNGLTHLPEIQGSPMYISKRDDWERSKQHSIQMIVREIAKQYFNQKNINYPHIKQNSGSQKPLSAREIQHIYRNMLIKEAVLNGGSVTLYGCSTTSLFEYPYFGAPPQQLFGSGMFSTFSRIGIPTVSSFGEKEVCVTCPHCQNTKGNTQNLSTGNYRCGNAKCSSNK